MAGDPGDEEELRRLAEVPLVLPVLDSVDAGVRRCNTSFSSSRQTFRIWIASDEQGALELF